MKKILQMAMAIVAMLCLSESLYAGPSSNNYYFIQAKASQQSLSNQNSKNAKTPIVQKAGSQDSQRWRFVSAGGGYYYIISKRSGLYLDVKGGSKDKGTIVWQYRRNTTAAQKWKLIDAGGGYYYIQSNISGLYRDVQGGSTKDGATIWQYPLNRTDAQKWKLINAGSVSNINRAKMASIYGPTIKTVKIFTHEFNFGKSITVQKSGSGKVVKGRFSHHKSFRDDDEYYFAEGAQMTGRLIAVASF
ncbi:MAG: RICIN domain-containing protein [Phaeodactylibacter sp.]|nr:RICIN domain-containing protein [Phaeodactylibacter sp.]